MPAGSQSPHSMRTVRRMLNMRGWLSGIDGVAFDPANSAP
jgi:hypothetical protein